MGRSDSVQKNPDERARTTIELILERFETERHCRWRLRRIALKTRGHSDPGVHNGLLTKKRRLKSLFPRQTDRRRGFHGADATPISGVVPGRPRRTR